MSDNDELDRGMLNDQEGDDFANFDPKRYLTERNKGALVGDDPDEVQFGAASPRRFGREIEVDRNDLRPGASRRDDENDRLDRNQSRNRRQMKRREGCLTGVFGLLTGALFTPGLGRFARIALFGGGCLVLLVLGAVCVGGVWLITALRG
jgi:hypothetical protein